MHFSILFKPAAESRLKSLIFPPRLPFGEIELGKRTLAGYILKFNGHDTKYRKPPVLELLMITVWSRGVADDNMAATMPADALEKVRRRP
jgi:methionine salvage enolase-phosphatase E1